MKCPVIFNASQGSTFFCWRLLWVPFQKVPASLEKALEKLLESRKVEGKEHRWHPLPLLPERWIIFLPNHWHLPADVRMLGWGRIWVCPGTGGLGRPGQCWSHLITRSHHRIKKLTKSYCFSGLPSGSLRYQLFFQKELDLNHMSILYSLWLLITEKMVRYLQVILK